MLCTWFYILYKTEAKWFSKMQWVWDAKCEMTDLAEVTLFCRVVCHSLLPVFDKKRQWLHLSVVCFCLAIVYVWPNWSAPLICNFMTSYQQTDLFHLHNYIVTHLQKFLYWKGASSLCMYSMCYAWSWPQVEWRWVDTFDFVNIEWSN